MAETESERSAGGAADGDGVCPLCGARKGKRPKRWYERTSVTLCVAGGLAVVGLGFVHVITGVTSPHNLPFDVVRRDSFGYRELLVDAERIKSMPYAVALREHPLGVAALQKAGYLPSGPRFEARRMAEQQYNTRKWLAEFERAIGKNEPPWPDRLRTAEAGQGDPESARACNDRGVTLARQGQYASALAEFARAIRRDPTYLDAFHNRVLVYVAIGNLGPAAADLGSMLAIRPDSSKTCLRRGRLHAAIKDHDKAIADFTKALELIPDDLEALFHRSLAHYAKGEYSEADRDLERIERLGVAVPSGFLQAVRAMTARGRGQESISRRR